MDSSINLATVMYITWILSDQASWTIKAAGVGANPTVGISARLVPQEPMQYIIANLGMSTNFGPVDLSHLPFPCHLTIDYIRVYQEKGAINIGCDPLTSPQRSTYRYTLRPTRIPISRHGGTTITSHSRDRNFLKNANIAI
ncbi:beta-glucan synthesis-associated protein-domain-containing protein [Mycena haematopus]|nr:beta-glucan synthesis-associated protein-domain-containing protein [Mycena haematopus]